MIKPTIGRVVWYNDSEESNQPLAAIVCYVWNDEMVNLTVFIADGTTEARSSVRLWQGEGERPTDSPFAEWMPYQKGQAAKAEELEKKLNS